jgi:hypothetical protein
MAPNECATCHVAAGNGMIRTEYDTGSLSPSGVLRGDDHDLNFRTSHRFAAQNDDAYCGNCHRKSFCVDCHNGVVKPMDFHGNDYLTLHTIDARRSSTTCTACHRLQTFCVGCHSRSGVSPDGRGGDFGSRDPALNNFSENYHPAGWVRFNPGLQLGGGSRERDHHSFEAQRNIEQCAACHREDFCAGCHTEMSDVSSPNRQPGVNPHPNNWANSRRCEALRARAGRMCLRCHVNSAQVTCDPRQP